MDSPIPRVAGAFPYDSHTDTVAWVHVRTVADAAYCLVAKVELEPSSALVSPAAVVVLIADWRGALRRRRARHARGAVTSGSPSCPPVEFSAWRRTRSSGGYSRRFRTFILLPSIDETWPLTAS